MGVSVGIDLGTTFSAVAYIDPKTKQPTIIPNREGKRITPSVIQFLDGEVIFGSEAEEALASGESDCVATFKREMGSNEPYCYIDGEPYTSEQLSGLLLRHLKEEAEAALGDTIADAVITVPAYFYSREREATLNAAKAAGLPVRKIIDEPNAAAMAYGLDHWRENANIRVYDLGGGTFDVTLVHMGKGGQLSTITTRGNHKLGGRDWDDRIENILLERFEADTGLDLRSDADACAIIRGLSESVKKRLSSMTTVKVGASFSGFGRLEVSISRQEFEESTSDLLEQTGALCQAVLEEAGLRVRDVADVLLVGGSSRMPQVRSYLQRLFGKPPIMHVNPDEAVALGAAIQSSKGNEGYAALSVQIVDGKKRADRSSVGLNVHAAVKPPKKLSGVSAVTLRETTAHAMGIIAVNEDGTRYINDVIIPANHPRPVRCAKAFYVRTKPGKSQNMEIFVVQGDKDAPLENVVAFRYIVSGIRHVPRQRNTTMVRVQYSYDSNGIIRVSARQENDMVNLPIRRETIPDDMSRFARPVEKGPDRPASRTGSNSVGLYSKWAGISNIPTTSRDRFGNPNGDEYDLVEDGAFEGEIVYILNLCARECQLNAPQGALTKKGFVVIEDTMPPDEGAFRSRLAEASQFWLISDRSGYLLDFHVTAIIEFFQQGHGIYIWGDNDPYYVDANKVAQNIFGISMSGNSYGDQIVSLHNDGSISGIVEDHLIGTGIVNIYEGITIAEIQCNDEILPLIYGSDGKVVSAYYDSGGCRAIIDGGFTRLCNKWDSAGTDRYIVNAAAWLANLERFADVAADTAGENETREVETWDD